MVAFDFVTGFLAIVATGIAFVVLAKRARRTRFLAIGAAWIGAVAGAIGAAVALCGLVFAVFAIWSGWSGPWGPWDGVGHPQPRHSAMVALGVAIGAAVIALTILVHGLCRKKPD